MWNNSHIVYARERRLWITFFFFLETAFLYRNKDKDAVVRMVHDLDGVRCVVGEVRGIRIVSRTAVV